MGVVAADAAPFDERVERGRGRGGKGFMRMNIGTPRVNVMKALDRLKSALS